jgi:hypothetical protein
MRGVARQALGFSQLRAGEYRLKYQYPRDFSFDDAGRERRK